MNTELYGLVLCGGQGSRMGTAKHQLNIHGISQREFTSELLKPFCSRIFFSANKKQAADFGGAEDVIYDAVAYAHCGPMSGLLSACEAFPGKSFLVVACDYPCLQRDDLGNLLAARKAGVQVVCLLDTAAQVAVPVIGVYESACFEQMHVEFQRAAYSLRKFIEKIPHCLVPASSAQSVFSVDTPADLQHAKNILNKN